MTRPVHQIHLKKQGFLTPLPRFVLESLSYFLALSRAYGIEILKQPLNLLWEKKLM